MPTITKARLEKYQKAEKLVHFFQSGEAWIEYSKMRERNRRRGGMIILLACLLMVTITILFFYFF